MGLESSNAARASRGCASGIIICIVMIIRVVMKLATKLLAQISMSLIAANEQLDLPFLGVN